MTNWISCTTPPIEDDPKLIWMEYLSGKYKVGIGYYDSGSWWFQGRLDKMPPTHWADMPEGPKDELS